MDRAPPSVRLSLFSRFRRVVSPGAGRPKLLPRATSLRSLRPRRWAGGRTGATDGNRGVGAAATTTTTTAGGGGTAAGDNDTPFQGIGGAHAPTMQGVMSAGELGLHGGNEGSSMSAIGTAGDEDTVPPPSSSASDDPDAPDTTTVMDGDEAPAAGAPAAEPSAAMGDRRGVVDLAAEYDAREAAARARREAAAVARGRGVVPLPALSAAAAADGEEPISPIDSGAKVAALIDVFERTGGVVSAVGLGVAPGSSGGGSGGGAGGTAADGTAAAAAVPVPPSESSTVTLPIAADVSAVPLPAAADDGDVVGDAPPTSGAPGGAGAAAQPVSAATPLEPPAAAMEAVPPGSTASRTSSSYSSGPAVTSAPMLTIVRSPATVGKTANGGTPPSPTVPTTLPTRRDSQPGDGDATPAQGESPAKASEAAATPNKTAVVGDGGVPSVAPLTVERDAAAATDRATVLPVAPRAPSSNRAAAHAAAATRVTGDGGGQGGGGGGQGGRVRGGPVAAAKAARTLSRRALRRQPSSASVATADGGTSPPPSLHRLFQRVPRG